MKNFCTAGAIIALAALSGTGWGAAPDFRVQAADSKNQFVTVVTASGRETRIGKHEKFTAWTLMAVLPEPHAGIAVFETVGDDHGSIVYLGTQGVVASLPKSLEPTRVAASSLYRGRSREEISQSQRDVLAEELLAGEDDPSWDIVAGCLPPLRVPTFVGTRHSIEKPTYAFGAVSGGTYVDVGKVFTEIQEARDKGDVWEGLVGGWLPVVRFVFPVSPQRSWEALLFAEEDPEKFWTQPVWYRSVLVDRGQLKEAHYFYHHLPFPPRGEPDASAFFGALLNLHNYWHHELNPPMKVEVPETRIVDFSMHGLAREMITRVGNHPKYGYPPLGGIGVVGGYGYSNVDTFQDIFNSSVTAMLEWGLFDVAAGYIDDYFTNSVRDDGSIDTRGPEIGQYGKMLSVLAKYYDYTKDARLMRKHQKKIQAIVNLFYSLRDQAKRVPPEDASYGIIRGWSEHDSSLKVNPFQYMLPHISNNAEASRGFHDLGRTWTTMGQRLNDLGLQDQGGRMLKESEAMKHDLYNAISRTLDRTRTPAYLPAVPGNMQTHWPQRVYSELLDSAVLNQEQVTTILDYESTHQGTILALPRGATYITGFLDFGPAFARLQNDRAREFLLFYYAHMAHIYSRGTWTSVESASGRMDGTMSGPYATPSQVTIPILTKWMLVFEDPDEAVLWLARATPRAWLEEGRKIAVSGAPTRFGTVAYELRSNLTQDKVTADVRIPDGFKGTVRLRCRVPGGRKIRALTRNGVRSSDFAPDQELITIPPGVTGQVRLEILY